ncbi:MAG: hypothetical protein R3E53_07575 [Myxococcota bacterium]
MTGPQLTPGYWRDGRTARAYVRPPGRRSSTARGIACGAGRPGRR